MGVNDVRFLVSVLYWTTKNKFKNMITKNVDVNESCMSCVENWYVD
jgi:hypothetical protein